MMKQKYSSKIQDIQSNKKDENNNVNDENNIEEEEMKIYLFNSKHKMISYLVEKIKIYKTNKQFTNIFMKV